MPERSEQVDELGFDEVLARLRGVVAKLEQGSLGLEDSLRVYEEGVTLARRGHTLLDGAEKRVELLLRVGENGPVTEPLDSLDADDAGNAGGSARK